MSYPGGAPVTIVGGSSTSTNSMAGTTSNPLAVQSTSTQAPSSSAANSITPTVGSGVSSIQPKTTAGNLYGASIVASTTAGYLIAYNSATVPASGAALTAAQVLYVAPVAANGFASIGGNFIPDRFSNGVTLLFSTSTTTYTIPATLALHMRGSAA